MKYVVLSLVATIHFLVAFFIPATVLATEQPLTIYIPFGPGGAVDMAARILADFWKEAYGQQTDIVSMGGGAGNSAIMAFNAAKPDGHTVLFISTSTYVAGVQLMTGTGGLKNIIPIGQASVMWVTLAVNSDSSVKTVNQLFQHVRKGKGKVFYGTHGPLSTQRLFMLRLMRSIAPDMEKMLNHVSLGSGYAVHHSVLSGRIYAGFGVPANFHDGVAARTMRLLAVSSPARLPEYPEVATFAELYGPEFVCGAPHGFVTHAAAPPERVYILRERLAAALANPKVQKRLAAADIPPVYADANAFGQTLQEQWTEIEDLLKSGLL